MQTRQRVGGKGYNLTPKKVDKVMGDLTEYSSGVGS